MAAIRNRVVVGPFGSHRVICSDGTVWVEKTEGAPIRNGLKQWVQVVDEIPDSKPPRTKKPSQET